MNLIYTSSAVSLENSDVSLDRQKVMNLVVIYFYLIFSNHADASLKEMMIHHGFVQLFHRMNDLVQVYNLDIKAFFSKVH